MPHGHDRHGLVGVAGVEEIRVLACGMGMLLGSRTVTPGVFLVRFRASGRMAGLLSGAWAGVCGGLRTG